MNITNEDIYDMIKDTRDILKTLDSIISGIMLRLTALEQETEQ